jgi:O-acetyl-ADP-ribose deacetylase (regulator of RNase III)
VGLAEIVRTGHTKVPFLISAPTMRVPMSIPDTVNVYLATRAAMILVKYGELDDGTKVNGAVKTLAMPGMGTGIGRVSPRIAARQMKDAIEDILHDRQVFPESWREAKNRHERMAAGLPARR